MWAHVDDDGITPVVQLPALRDLALWTNRVTGDGIARLARKATLERLGHPAFDHLPGTALAQLRHLPALRALSVRSSKVADVEVAHLAGLPHLRELDLFAINVPVRSASCRPFPRHRASNLARVPPPVAAGRTAQSSAKRAGG